MVEQFKGPSRDRFLLRPAWPLPSQPSPDAEARGPSLLNQPNRVAERADESAKTAVHELGSVPAGAERGSRGAGRLDASRIAAFLDAIDRDPRLELSDLRHEPPRLGRYSPWPEFVPDILKEALVGRGIQRPYGHQARAFEALQRGRDVVLATQTASGKSLCYQLPILTKILQNPDTRAICIFPTKALARDQAQSLRELIAASPGLCGRIGVGVYDGDATPDERRAALKKAHIILTNPDMLHRSILPQHGRFAAVMSALRFVVLDELHVYRGVFGSHVAQVLRRLWRISGHYGSSPQVIACSATIANAKEHAQALCGRASVEEIRGQDAPVGARSFVIVNPAVVDPLTGVRGDYLKATRKVAQHLLDMDVQSLVFCRTRKAVELVTRYLREDRCGYLRDGEGVLHGQVSDAARQRARDDVRGYRGGYLPNRRRQVEQALREGEAKLVATTNALELGIDVGALDAVVMAGYAGSRAATWQRAGRAGRQQAPSLAVMVCSSAPRDQFIASKPEFLHAGSIESARIDPDNPDILLPHLRCAAAELSLGTRDPYPGIPAADLPEILEPLIEAKLLIRELGPGQSEQYFAIGEQFPAESVDLRGPIEENFSVIDAQGAHGRPGEVLAEVDFQDAPMYLHVGAIYPVEGEPHEVRRLDWDARKAFVHPVQSSYFTEAICKLKVRLIETETLLSIPQTLECGLAWAHVLREVPGFKKIRFGSHENIGFGPVDLPPLEQHTRAFFVELEGLVALSRVDAKQKSAVALCLAYAMQHVAAMLCMCEPSDLGRAVCAERAGAWAEVLGRGSASASAQMMASGVPVLYLYDQAPGGIGLVEQVAALRGAFFEQVLDFLRGCPCQQGCPSCLGPDHAALSERGRLRTGLLDAVQELVALFAGSASSVEQAAALSYSEESEAISPAGLGRERELERSARGAKASPTEAGGRVDGGGAWIGGASCV